MDEGGQIIIIDVKEKKMTSFSGSYVSKTPDLPFNRTTVQGVGGA